MEKKWVFPFSAVLQSFNVKKWEKSSFWFQIVKLEREGRSVGTPLHQVWESLPKLKLPSRGLGLAKKTPYQGSQSLRRVGRPDFITTLSYKRDPTRFQDGDNWHCWTSRNHFTEYKALFSPHQITVALKRILGKINPLINYISSRPTDENWLWLTWKTNDGKQKMENKR